MRTKSTTFILLAGIAATLAAPPASAHHAFTAEFDGTKPVTLEGVVTRMDWVNPHSWIYIDVTQSNGSVTKWEVEAGAPNAMFRRGWNKNSIPVGTEIVVEGYRAKNGKNIANGRNVTFPDGRKMFVGSSGTGAPLDGADSTER
jgi:hypothetical protein